MKYWVIDGTEAKGPFDSDELKKLPGFGPSSLIAPDGADTADQWKPASYYLLKPPTRTATPVEEKPKPALTPVVEPEPEPTAPAPQLEPPASRSPLLPLAIGLAALAAVGGGAYYARQQKIKQAALAAAAAPAPAPVPVAPAAPPPMPAVDDATRADALNLVQNFAVVSAAGTYPANPFDVLSPRRWKAPATLGELYETRPLGALALEALQKAQRRGESAAQGAREIRKDPESWKTFSDAFLKTLGRAKWDVEPEAGDLVMVTAHLRSPRTGAPEHRAFEADLKRRTLKPVDFDSWCDIDAKECASWARAHLALGQSADDAMASQAAPLYPWTRVKAIKRRKQAPGTRPIALEQEEEPPTRSKTPRKPAQAAAQKPAKPAAPAQPEDADDFDPLAGAQAAGPSQSDAPAQTGEPEPQAAQPSEQPLQPPGQPQPSQSQASPDASSPQSPAPAPDKASNLQTSPGAKKSVTDMSVDELENYLNRKQ